MYGSFFSSCLNQNNNKQTNEKKKNGYVNSQHNVEFEKREKILFLFRYRTSSTPNPMRVRTALPTFQWKNSKQIFIHHGILVLIFRRPLAISLALRYHFHYSHIEISWFEQIIKLRCEMKRENSVAHK